MRVQISTQLHDFSKYKLIIWNMSKRAERIVREVSKKSKTEVGKGLGLSRERIGQIVKDVTGTRNPDLTGIEQETIIDMWGVCKLLGITMQDIAEENGFSQVYVSNMVSSANIKMKRYGTSRKKAFIDALVEMIASRLSVVELRLDKIIEDLK